MADTYYAWSRINVTPAGERDKPASPKFVEVGDAVAKDKLPKEQFEELVKAGVLRKQRYPDMGASANQMSPVQFLLEEARRTAEGDEEATVAAMEAAESVGDGGTTQVPAT